MGGGYVPPKDEPDFEGILGALREAVQENHGSKRCRLRRW